MPAFYYRQRVNYPHGRNGSFSVDFYMFDSNKGDAKPFGADPKHNICGSFNSGNANCAKNKGPANRFACASWFDKLWREEMAWIEQGLNTSTADWQILMTHFP